MKTRYLVGLACILVVVGAVWYFYKQPGADNSAGPAKVFKVGVLSDKTGVMAAHGQSIEMGVMVAQKVLNDRGGILGRHVEVVSLDTQSDPAVSVERARELIQRDRVDLLIGTGLSSETLAVIPVVTQARIPFIYSMDGECKTCVAGHPDKVSDSVWGAGFTERMAVRPFMQYLVDHVLPKKVGASVFLLGGDYVYPRATNAYAKEVARSLGLRIVGDEYVDLATKDYSTIIRRVEQSGADLLLVTHPGDAAVAFMRQAKQFELDKKIVISGFATFAQEAISSMGNAAEGVYYTNRYSDTLNNPENTLFLKEFRAMYPGQPSLPGPSVAAGGYGPLMVAAAAIQKAGSLDSAAFRNAMKGLQVALPQGVVVVDAQNNIFQQHMYLLKIHEQKYTVLADLGLLKHPALEGCSVK
jgi:urea transport system substrate-binding protein